MNRSSSPLPNPDFRTVFESAPGLYLVFTVDLRIVAASDAYLRVAMTKREQILGRHLDEVASTVVPGLRPSLENVLRSRAPDAMPVQKDPFHRPGSAGGPCEERHWRPVNSPVLGSDGEIVYVIHLLEEVTDVLRLKQIALLYEQLRQLDQLKSRSFASLSHELRTPLTLILGPLKKLLSDGALSEAQRRDLGVVEHNARSLLKHVNDLLDVSKLDAGKLTLGYAGTDLAGLVRQTAAGFDALAQERRLDFSVETPDFLSAQVDADKVQRVVMNLLSNAFKFTPPQGRVRCTLGTGGAGSQATGRGAAVLTISDSGPGVPPDQRESIFDLFYQAEEPSGLRLGGTGLGLAIARDFVELHGGTIGVDDAPEGGARFVVELPLVAPPGVALAAASGAPNDAVTADVLELPAEPPSPAGAGGEVRDDSDQPLILVVEDESIVSRYVRSILSREYRTETAGDGQEGLGKAISLRPDLIVSDVMMPNMGGIQMVREIRSRPELDAIPIIMLTAKAEGDLRVRLLREGAQDFLLKPFSADELLARARNLVSVKRTREHLQTGIASRTQDLEKLALEVGSRTRDLARSNAELERFAYVASHDLQEPLRMITSFTELLAKRYRRQLGPEADELIDFAVQGAGRMKALIEGLLAYSRVTGKCEPFQLVDCETALGRALDNLHLAIKENEAIVTHDPLPILSGDRFQLTQLFQNLIGNALKFRSAVPPCVHVGAEERGDEVVFSVRDNGIGIHPKYADRIFVIFQRLHGGMEYPGTGIGLALSKKIVERHGGRIWVDSRPGEGATFLFALPLRSVPGEIQPPLRNTAGEALRDRTPPARSDAPAH